MCGIVVGVDFTGKPVNNWILDQFDSQRHRGVQGFGLFDGRKMRRVRATTEDKILDWLCKHDSSLIMFHHRFPTSTVNAEKAAHPFSTKKYFGNTEYILIHNGVIRNPKELAPEHKKLGIKYQSLLEDKTFNDSEALLWDFALFMEGKQKDMEAVGRMAFVCLKLVEGKLDKMYFLSNNLLGSPLYLYRDKKGMALSSEGKGESIIVNHLYTYNYKAKRLTSKYMYLPQYEYKAPTTAPIVKSGQWDDENEEYRKWWESRGDKDAKQFHLTSDDQKAGSWMGAKLKKKFARFYDNNGELIDTQVMSPATAELYAQGLRLSDAEVATCAGAYLIGSEGHFEKAYWAMEVAYVRLQDEPATRENVRELVLIENALEYLGKDPEYIDDSSVSSTWDASLQQKLPLVS